MKRILVVALLLAAAPLGFCDAGLAPDQNPRALVTKMPVIPAALASAIGQVELLVETNPHGFVTHATVKSATNPGFEQPCLDAILQWRFTPASKGGQSVAATFIQPLEFADGLMAATTVRPVSRPPRPVRRMAPDVPEALRHVTGYAIIAVTLDAKGAVTATAPGGASHEELYPPCLTAVRQWRFSPALDNGLPVAATVHVPFRFVGDPIKPDVAARAEPVKDHDLRPLRQPGPDLPAALADVAGEAEIGFLVDRNGYVAAPEIRSATRPELGELARQTVLGWKYQPAVKNGEPVAIKVVQPFRFAGGVMTTESKEAVDKPPVPRKRVQPELPEALRGISGRVVVVLAIDREGNVTAAEARESSVPELEAPVLAAARQWKFRPAVKIGVAIDSKVTVPFVFGGK